MKSAVKAVLFLLHNNFVFANTFSMEEKKMIKQSQFTGGLLGFIGVGLAQILLIVFTLGIATPWAVCFKEKWYAEHTIINGKRLSFDGKGIQLFGNYIKWLLLTIVTLGVYGFWLNIKMKQWVVSHTHFA